MTVKRDATDEQRRAIAQALDGEPLYALVAQCVEKGDVSMLKELKEAGRFDLKLENILESRTISREWDNAFMHTSALPMIDSLAHILYEQTEATHSYAKWSKDNTDRQTVKWNWYSPSNELKFIVGEILYDTLTQFRTLVPEIDQNAREDFIRIRKATLSVIATIGCANNDHGIVRDCISQEPDCMYTKLVADPLIKNDASFFNKICVPHTYALYFGSDRVLDMLGPKYFTSSMTEQNINTAYTALYAGNPKKSQKPDSLGDLMNTFGSWRRPDVAPHVLKLLVNEEGKVLKEHVNYVNDSLVPQMVKPKTADSLHLLEMTLEKFPHLFDFGRKVAEDAAKFQCIPELLEKFISKMEFPRPNTGLFDEKTAEHCICFQENHPIEQLLVGATDQIEVVVRDPDACFLMVIQEMERRHILTDLFETVEKDTGRTFAHFAAANGWEKSIAHLIRSGMDFTVKSKEGTTPEMIAEQQDNGCGPMIRTANTAKEAMSVLAEMNSSLGLGLELH